jgi:hypothetical protein
MAHADEVPRERGLYGTGENGQAIPISLPTGNGDLAAPEVDVLHPEPGAFEQAETGTVEQRRHEPGNALELADHDADFVAAEHDGAGRLVRTTSSSHGTSRSSTWRYRKRRAASA